MDVHRSLLRVSETQSPFRIESRNSKPNCTECCTAHCGVKRGSSDQLHGHGHKRLCLNTDATSLAPLPTPSTVLAVVAIPVAASAIIEPAAMAPVKVSPLNGAPAAAPEAALAPGVPTPPVAISSALVFAPDQKRKAPTQDHGQVSKERCQASLAVNTVDCWKVGSRACKFPTRTKSWWPLPWLLLRIS